MGLTAKILVTMGTDNEDWGGSWVSASQPGNDGSKGRLVSEKGIYRPVETYYPVRYQERLPKGIGMITEAPSVSQ
jgi:hypothetical protein